ncbi:MAG TPA: diguanylate cyclase [Longimicrobium sp.]|jgi:diguanylate cyclase (GGDEF)-like protein|uniref:diguanylate cyclase n=1 Tax=Longimicrobium sp. TaxID=2029185 RepID=UPI002EDACC51
MEARADASSERVPAVAIAPDGDLRARVDRLNDEAWALRHVRPERAQVLLAEALRLSADGAYAPGAALALRTRGQIRYYTGSDYDGGMADCRRALEMLEAAGEERGRADAMNGIGCIHLRLGEHAEAMRHHLRALEIQRRSGDRAGEGSSLNHLGNVSYRLGDYGQALEYYHAGLQVHESVGDAVGVSYSLNNIGIVHGQMGEPRHALEYMLRALKANEDGDRQLAGVSMVNVGMAYAAMGDDDRALHYLRRAAVQLRETGARDGEASCVRDIGALHERRGDLVAAMDSYEASVDTTRALRSRAYLAEALISRGALRARMGDVAGGLADVREALSIAESLDAKPLVYTAHEAAARVLEAKGDAAGALHHHRAYHAVWTEVFNAGTNARVKAVLVRAEVQQAQREAELLRAKNDELTAAYARLRAGDEEKGRLLDQLSAQAAELERQTREDALTGLSNRRDLDDRLGAEWERARRFGRALSVAMVDVDHFKRVNDRFSHAAGDQVLRTVARILREHTRGVDVVARYGGEEFCLVMVETDPAAARGLCERLRAGVEAHPWSEMRPGLSVTISIGIAGHLEADAPEALLAIADARLYSAKHAGRNRVCAS